ncbi:hypothetical protein H8959_000170 [Pygathrix nigripes]
MEQLKSGICIEREEEILVHLSTTSYNVQDSYKGLNQLPFDPANNNEPLQFGSASGPLVTEGLIENGGESSKKRKRTNTPSVLDKRKREDIS